MKTEKLIIYGVGKFAEYAAYVFNNDSPYKVVGFCLEKEFIKKKEIKINQEIIPFEEVAIRYSPKDYKIFVAVGNNLVREKIYNIIKKNGFSLATYLSSKATTWPNLVVGENSFISEGNIIQPFTTIGDNSILFNNQIGHHCSIGNHSLVSVSILGGNVKVGDICYIGMGTVIKQNIKIEEKNILGMGCIIDKDTKPRAVFTTKATEQRQFSFDKVANLFLR